jgi:hypothetical protein
MDDSPLPPGGYHFCAICHLRFSEAGLQVFFESVFADAQHIATSLPGTEGCGIRDILFGDHKPKSKLPHAWSRPNEQPSLIASDLAMEDAQFPDGFGLS